MRFKVAAINNLYFTTSPRVYPRLKPFSWQMSRFHWQRLSPGVYLGLPSHRDDCHLAVESTRTVGVMALADSLPPSNCEHDDVPGTSLYNPRASDSTRSVFPTTQLSGRFQRPRRACGASKGHISPIARDDVPQAFREREGEGNQVTVYMKNR
jgi:hypothetical protein